MESRELVEGGSFGKGMEGVGEKKIELVNVFYVRK